MDSITTTLVPVSDIPIDRAISRRLSSRFPSSKDATYPDDIINDLSGVIRGMNLSTRSRTLNKSSSNAQRGSASARFEEKEEEEEDVEKGEEMKGGEEPVKMSLMALLGESEGSLYMMGEDDDDDEDDVGGELNNCCVCQVKHKGGAFVPCGHSFCRLCSRELWVEGANCPLCNNFIMEILDIF